MLLQTTITNDPTKELLQILREDMQHLWEQEMKQFNMLCDLLRWNKSTSTGNSYYNALGVCIQPHIPSSQPSMHISHIYFSPTYPPPPQKNPQLHLLFSQPDAQSLYPRPFL